MKSDDVLVFGDWATPREENILKKLIKQWLEDEPLQRDNWALLAILAMPCEIPPDAASINLLWKIRGQLETSTSLHAMERAFRNSSDCHLQQFATVLSTALEDVV